MIPHRIKLSGFLSYKEEQDVRFDGAAVWMLAGTNGSGKSSIFDGVTYALFGHHRGGSQNAAELINKDSTALNVEFDFKLDGRLYRLKRTLRKGNRGAVSGTQQVFAQPPGADGEDTWAAVADTNKKADFDKWVHEKIGLDYDTFTSSVLLLQGRAEKLLDSKPSGRAEVLAGIVDLERYQRLHAKANDKKLGLKAKLDTLSAQAAGVPDVGDLEFSAAIVRIDECEQARDAARKKVDEAADLGLHARRWADAEARLTAARDKLRQSEAVLSDAVKIEKEFARLAELREVLPAVNTAVTCRARSSESMRRAERLHKDREEATERRRKAEAALDQAKRQKTLHAKALASNEEVLGELTTRLRELHGLLQTVRLADDEEAKQKRLADELAALPRDPEADLKAARLEAEKLDALDRVLPILERVQTERFDLTQAVKKEVESRRERDRTAQAGKEAKAEGEKRKAELAAARQAKATADSEAAVARAEADRTAAAVAEFAAKSGSKECSACGQPLTPAHFKEEKARRDEARAKADARLKAATVQAKAAADRERALADDDAVHAKTLETLRDEYKDFDAVTKTAAAEIKRLTESLALRYAEMPEPYRSRIAPSSPKDWPATAYPQRDELIELRRTAGTLTDARRKVREAEATLKKFDDLRSRTDASRQSLDKLRKQLPDDVGGLRREYEMLQSQETTLTADIKAVKPLIEQTDRDIDRHGSERHQGETRLTEIVGKLNAESVTQKLSDEQVAAALQQLPAAWREKAAAAGMKDQAVWKSELDELETKGIEAKHRQLEQARVGLGALRDDLARLAVDADGFPPEVRRSAEEVKMIAAAARADADDREKELREAQKHRDKLDGYREQRAKLGEQFKTVDGEHTRYKVLSELLGRDRLQRHLVRQAERQIVDYGNAVLDRLSGGQLFLKLVAGDDGSADKALDLECYNRVTGGAPINVTFLSGSQRFRVAVSLALAIGQYASRQHRPIESVIIDEGFGCLDRQGRQVMIQELQNLRGHLHCILLVSHQEEFADAFADGYRFELQDGATRVSRFQR